MVSESLVTWAISVPILVFLGLSVLDLGLDVLQQSAYRTQHSTEAAVLKTVSDILWAADSGKVTLLGLFDMSAAFDTVDHNILIDRLNTSFGIRGAVLSWIQSFTTGRSQAVRVGDD